METREGGEGKGGRRRCLYNSEDEMRRWRDGWKEREKGIRGEGEEARKEGVRKVG